MDIYVNGKKESLSDNLTISEFLKLKNIRVEVVVVELNDEIIERKDFQNKVLKDGDRIELIFYMGGGSPFYDAVAQDISSLIFKTPIVKLKALVDDRCADIYAKLESFNPGGSVKDRICLSMIEDAEKRGILKKGFTVIEPTSGNTGIGLAMICALKGYRCILTMPETMSQERIFLLKSYGAEVVLTKGIEGMEGSIKKAFELRNKIPNSFIPMQFENPANPEIHRKTTALEILSTVGDDIDAFVAGVGTGGTITGVGEVLKSRNGNVKIIAVEPKSSPVLSGGKPGPHKIQGIGAGFVPKVLNVNIIDEIITVSDEDAFVTSKYIANKEGILVGISSGAACFAALQVAKRLGKGKKIVTIFPDTGERYFSIEQYFNI